jgi:hypothetical protein
MAARVSESLAHTEASRNRSCNTNGVKGRVVLIIGDEATTFDSASSDQTFVVQ